MAEHHFEWLTTHMLMVSGFTKNILLNIIKINNTNGKTNKVRITHKHTLKYRHVRTNYKCQKFVILF